MQTIALYTTDTMADWEYAYLTTQITAAEQIRPGRFRLLLVGDGTGPVTSLGGLPLTPQTDLADLPSLAQDGSLGALVIPGGNTCTTQPHERLVTAVHAVMEHRTPVAAICGATFLLARAGLLDERRCWASTWGRRSTTGGWGPRPGSWRWPRSATWSRRACTTAWRRD